MDSGGRLEDHGDMKNVDFESCVAFHGHRCPGLAIGYRMAVAAMDALEKNRAEDEQLGTIVENDACGVDALQVVAGCTFGKGNLVFRDVGKSVYTVFSRETGRGVRVNFHGHGLSKTNGQERSERIEEILSAPVAAILSIRDVAQEIPPAAQIHGSMTCALCGERVMETRTRSIDGKVVCIPCSEPASRA